MEKELKDLNDKSLVFEKGDKVHYIPHHIQHSGLHTVGGLKYYAENGIVKRVTDSGVFVVYKCGGEWSNYENYTAALTEINDLRHGWLE